MLASPSTLESNIGKHVATENIKPTEEILGKGSYGEVVKIIMRGQTVAGKRIHSILLEDGQEGREQLIRRFEEECVRYINLIKSTGGMGTLKVGLSHK